MKPCNCGMNQGACVNGTGDCMVEPIIGNDDISKAKQVVLQKGLGICSLSEFELLQTLEEIYWLGFKSGMKR